MKITNIENLKNMNFADFKVLNMFIDKNTRIINFSLTGAYYSLNGELTTLGNGNLKIKGYNSVSISSYNAKNKQEVTLTEDSYEYLSELCEIEQDKNKLTIKGFAKDTYNWIEFTITGGEIIGEFKTQ